MSNTISHGVTSAPSRVCNDCSTGNQEDLEDYIIVVKKNIGFNMGIGSSPVRDDFYYNELIESRIVEYLCNNGVDETEYRMDKPVGRLHFISCTSRVKDLIEKLPDIESISTEINVLPFIEENQQRYLSFYGLLG